MLSRRQAMKITIGSFVAALPLGPRAVAAIPADLDAPAVEMLDTTDAPWWDGMCADADRMLCERPDLDGMRFWQWYEVELLRRVDATHPAFPFRVGQEMTNGFTLEPDDGDLSWMAMVIGRQIVLCATPTDTVDFDALLGRLIDALAAR